MAIKGEERHNGKLHQMRCVLIGLGIFLFWLYMIYQAYSQREFHIPWMGDIAAKQVH